MIRRLDLRSGLPANLGAVVPRAQIDVEHALDVVRPIVADVAKRGAPAVLDHGERLDGLRPKHLRVPAAELSGALDRLDPEVRQSLEVAIERVRTVHTDQLPKGHTTQVVPGGTVTMQWIPVDRVGLYVPGGRAVYPSSVVMNVVPAQIAGVGSLAVASPPHRDNAGYPHPTILAACAMLGVQEVYAAGGAQAIALLAYGAPLDDGSTCRPVDLVTGPGNIWVTAAKRLLMGRIGIDSEAGPTEIAILADDTADPHMVAADLISQAEHDVIAASVLVTSSARLASAVEAALGEQVATARHSLRIREALSGMQSAIILVDSIRDGLAVVNAYGAEHLEIHTRKPREVAKKVRNAGAVFIGPYSPVPLGDYAAGSNHVLPTGGSACHSSGLGVASFMRGVNFIEYDESALAGVADHVVTLAHAEDLPGHASAITARFER